MCGEEFRLISLPDILQTPEVNCSSLTVWKESVALFFFPGTRKDSQSIEVWVLMNDCLDDIGGDCTLIKQLVIEPVACPVAFWKRDEILMKSRKGKIGLLQPSKPKT